LVQPSRWNVPVHVAVAVEVHDDVKVDDYEQVCVGRFGASHPMGVAPRTRDGTGEVAKLSGYGGVLSLFGNHPYPYRGPRMP
jgi:hypothetical protein